jgi:hypothetical protein
MVGHPLLEFKSPVWSGLLTLFGGNWTKTSLWIPIISKDRNQTGKDRIFQSWAVLGPVATSSRPVQTAQDRSDLVKQLRFEQDMSISMKGR